MPVIYVTTSYYSRIPYICVGGGITFFFLSIPAGIVYIMKSSFSHLKLKLLLFSYS